MIHFFSAERTSSRPPTRPEARGTNEVITFFVNNVPLDASGDKVSEATAAAGRVLGRLCEVFYTCESPSEAKPASAKAAER